MIHESDTVQRHFLCLRDAFNDVLRDQPPTSAWDIFPGLIEKLSHEENQQLLGLLRALFMVSCKDLSEKHNSSPTKCGFSREVRWRILCMLECNRLLSNEELESIPDLELSDWIAELLERLGVCVSGTSDWKTFLHTEITERYSSKFGLTLLNVYLNLGLEPPGCLPKDDFNLTGASVVSDNNPDESDQIDPPSPKSKPEALPTTETSRPSRVEMRQCLPRALFADSAIVSAAKALHQGKASGAEDVAPITASSHLHPTVAKFADTHTHDRQLVLITCPRSRRKCHTPTKLVRSQRGTRRTSKSRNPSGGESFKQASRHSRRTMNTSVPRARPSETCATSQPSHSDVVEYFARTEDSSRLPKGSTGKRHQHRRSVHETPDPEKSYPRWERAKLAAAEKTKGKAVIVEESPVKPLFCLGSPIRRLRRANSIRENACDHHSQMPGIDLTPNKSKLQGFGLDNYHLRLSQSSLGTTCGLYSGCCLSRTMSRAEQWRRRQLDEELSLSQFGIENTLSPNLKSPSGAMRNEQVNGAPCPEFCPSASESYRRSSNLFANMISPERPALQSPPKQTIVTPGNAALSTSTTPKTRLISPTNRREPTIKNEKTPNRLGPIDQFIRNSSATVEQRRVGKSVPRNRSVTPRSRLSRAQFPASSPIETSRDIPVSPQIFDEEAMFLAREEFLNVTNTTPSTDLNTPTSSSGRKRYSAVEEGIMEPQICFSPKNKRRRLQTIVSPDIIPLSSVVDKAHTPNTDGFSGAALADQPDSHLGRFIRLTRSRCGQIESSNKLLNGQMSPPRIADSAPSIRSPLVPLHIFNCSGQAGANGVSSYSDPLEHTTQSSQSASALVALRSRLFGNQDSDDSKPANSPGRIISSGDGGILSTYSSAVQENGPSKSAVVLVDEKSRHLWNDSSLDLPISPGLRKLRRSVVERLDEPPQTGQFSHFINKENSNRNTNRESCPRPRRSLFR